LLFVPGGEPRKLERARDAGADTLVLDLEDGVPPAEKAEARGRVAEVLRAGGFGTSEVAVRVNPPGTPQFEPDLEAVVAAGAHAIMLPKAERVEEVAALLRRMPDGVKLLLLVESPAGIVDAPALGRASPRVEALCFGHADFSLAMGLEDADASRGVAYHARCALAVAARACSIAPIDSVHLAVTDDAAFRDDAELGRRLGFDGKLCIHPRQVAIANAVHTPTREQIAHALRIVEGWERALAEGRGVFTLDGRMVDAPVVAVARRVLARARRADVLPADGVSS
jgi:citrate lyase subunit beta/citryl-CoA lyase